MAPRVAVQLDTKIVGKPSRAKILVVDDNPSKLAALEAIKGSQCDLLLVCGFAFDPHVSEQTQELKKEIRLGKLPILAVRMNPDLAIAILQHFCWSVKQKQLRRPVVHHCMPIIFSTT